MKLSSVPLRQGLLSLRYFRSHWRPCLKASWLIGPNSRVGCNKILQKHKSEGITGLTCKTTSWDPSLSRLTHRQLCCPENITLGWPQCLLLCKYPNNNEIIPSDQIYMLWAGRFHLYICDVGDWGLPLWIDLFMLFCHSLHYIAFHYDFIRVDLQWVKSTIKQIYLQLHQHTV